MLLSSRKIAYPQNHFGNFLQRAIPEGEDQQNFQTKGLKSGVSLVLQEKGWPEQSFCTGALPEACIGRWQRSRHENMLVFRAHHTPSLPQGSPYRDRKTMPSNPLCWLVHVEGNFTFISSVSGCLLGGKKPPSKMGLQSQLIFIVYCLHNSRVGLIQLRDSPPSLTRLQSHQGEKKKKAFLGLLFGNE